ELRRVLLCLIRVLDQIAHLHRVRGRDVRERLDNREAALLVHLGEVHRVHDVMALGVERDLALRRLEGEAALERLDDRVPLERPCLLHRRGPEVPAVPDGAGRVGDVDRKSTRLNSSHVSISYAVFCLKKKTFSRRLHTRIRKTRHMHKMRCLLINRSSLLLALRLLWKTPIFPSNSRFPRLCAKCLLKLKRLFSILPMTKSKK